MEIDYYLRSNIIPERKSEFVSKFLLRYGHAQILLRN